MAKSPAEVDEETLAKIRKDIKEWYPGRYGNMSGPACHCGMPWTNLTSNAANATMPCEPIPCQRHPEGR